MRRFLRTSAWISLAILPCLRAAEFEKVPIPGIRATAVDSPKANAWADFDNDGDLDLFQSGGGGVAQLWRNDSGNFVAVSKPEATGPGLGSALWFDFDNDGRLDLLHSGLRYDADAGYVVGTTYLWRNSTTGFVRESETGLPQIMEADLAVADFDRDGRLDLLMAGRLSENEPPGKGTAGIWRNTGNGFAPVVIPDLVQGDSSSVATADLDGDGRPDFVILSRIFPTEEEAVLVAQAWRNTPQGFELFENFPLPGMAKASLNFGDLDRDGRPDLLVAGSGADETGTFGGVTRVWLNTTDGFMRLAISGFTRDLGKTGALLDQDNDGWLDILASGSNSTEKTELWRQIGDGTGWQRIGIPGVPRLNVGTVSVADFDADGRTDLFLAGFGGRGVNLAFYAELWRNTTAVTNAPPDVPSGLTVTESGGMTTLRWDPASDDRTPSRSLTYNLRVGTVPGDVDVLSPESDPETGYRRLPRHGNAGWHLAAELRLPPGTYFAAVQAVDAGFAGGRFSAEVSFTVRPGLWIRPQGEAWLLEWDLVGPGWVVESAGSLDAPVWTREAAGTDGPLVLKATTGNRFYRLRRP